MAVLLIIMGYGAWRAGELKAEAEIIASACGDDTGEVAGGWEDYCAQRAADMADE